MSGRVKHLLLGKKDPTAQYEERKRNKDTTDPPQSPRSPLSPGFHLKPFKDLLNSGKPSSSPSADQHSQPPLNPPQQHSAPKKAGSQKSLKADPPILQKNQIVHSMPQPMATSCRKLDPEVSSMEDRKFRQRSASKASISTSSITRIRAGAESPPDMLRPSASRSSSQEGHFMHRVKASRHAAQSYGEKAAKITAKATSSTAKALGEKGSKAWGKLKEKAKSSKEPTPIIPQSQYLGNFKPKRSKKNPIDVWGMSLKEATMKTRVISEIISEADSAAYWTPAVAFRCLQYLNIHGPEELGLYRLSGSTAVVEELRADFVDNHDVDISLNPPNDIHTVTSLLKGYFRALPDAILPAEVQKRVYEHCKDQPESDSPPQFFLDELSRLPPYNYYMLYSLSAHLSIINQHSNVNKMNLSNLGMIFCSTLRIDRFCFNWLVGHWGHCFQGCWMEDEELERTAPNVLRKKRSQDVFTPMTRHDTRSTAPSSPAASSHLIHTPAQKSVASHRSPAHSPHLSPSQAPPSVSASPLIAQQTEPQNSPRPEARSAPATPRTPATPFTPANLAAGDDEPLMVHSPAAPISDHADDKSGSQKEAGARKGKESSNRCLTKDKEAGGASTQKCGNEVIPTAKVATKRHMGTSKKEPVEEKPQVVKDEAMPKPGIIVSQPELRIDGPSNDSPKLSSPKCGSPKSKSTPRPAHLQLSSAPPREQQKGTLGLPLMLPPLTPMSPLIATMDNQV